MKCDDVPVAPPTAVGSFNGREAARLPPPSTLHTRMPSFEQAIAAYADCAVRQRQVDAGSHAGDASANAEAVAQFLIAVHARMPGYLRTPFRMLGLLFDAWPILTTGRAFHRLDLAARAAQIQAWKDSRIEVRRRLMEFYDSLALFGLYSELYGRDYCYE